MAFSLFINYASELVVSAKLGIKKQGAYNKTTFLSVVYMYFHVVGQIGCQLAWTAATQYLKGLLVPLERRAGGATAAVTDSLRQAVNN